MKPDRRTVHDPQAKSMYSISEFFTLLFQLVFFIFSFYYQGIAMCTIQVSNKQLSPSCQRASRPPGGHPSTTIHLSTFTLVATVQEDYIYPSTHTLCIPAVPQQLLDQINMRQNHSPTTIPFQPQLIKSLSIPRQHSCNNE